MRPEGAALSARQPAARRKAGEAASRTKPVPYPHDARTKKRSRRRGICLSQRHALRRRGAARRHRAPLRHALLRLLARRDRGRATANSRARSKGRAALICYSVKANSNLAILALLRARGRRLRHRLGRRARARARRRRRAAQDAVLGRRQDARRRSRARCDAGILLLQRRVARPSSSALDAVARGSAGARRSRLRVNPDVDAATHPYISTGLRENKFGVALRRRRAALPRAAAHAAARGRRHRLPHRLAADRRRAVRRRGRAAARAGRPAERATASRSSTSMSAAASASATSDEAPPTPARFVARRARDALARPRARR